VSDKWGGLGQAPGHEGDHGPQDHGFVAGGQVLMIAGGSAVLADPGEGLSTTHRRGRISKVCRSRLATICMVIFMVVAQAVSLPAYPASAHTRRMRRQARCPCERHGPNAFAVREPKALLSATETASDRRGHIRLFPNFDIVALSLITAGQRGTGVLDTSRRACRQLAPERRYITWLVT
jgi:hypothetical protein